MFTLSPSASEVTRRLRRTRRGQQPRDLPDQGAPVVNPGDRRLATTAFRFVNRL